MESMKNALPLFFCVIVFKNMYEKIEILHYTK